jgi:hypothetical protein
MGEMRNACSILVGKPEGKRSLGKLRHGWENITMDLREIGLEDRDWIHLAQHNDPRRVLVKTLMNFQFP